MKRHIGIIKRTSDSHDIEEALAVLDERDLRQLITELVDQLDSGTRGLAIDRIVDRATRKNAGWAPKGPTGEAVAKILAFAKAARQDGWTEPEVVDGYLRQGSAAFLRKDYETARRIFGTLLPPLSCGEIVVGQEEMVEEALSVGVQACAASHVVSVYMTSAPDDRPEAVRAAIEDVGDLGVFSQPLRAMECVATEPLPDFQAFVRRWRSLIESSAPGSQSG